MLLVWLALTDSITASILANHDFVPLNCKSTMFSVFDPTKGLSGCNTCPLNLPSSTSENCACLVGYDQLSCSTQPVCGDLQTLSSDKTFCLLCPTTIEQKTIGNVNLNVCKCPTGQIYRDRDEATGNPLSTGICMPCSVGYYPNLLGSECLACPDSSNMIASINDNGEYYCTCKTAMGYDPMPFHGKCLIGSTLNTAKIAYGLTGGLVTLNNLLSLPGNSSKLTIQSDPFTYEYLPAVTNCDNYGDLNACQTVANLCVLAMYDRNQTSCKTYQSIATAPSRVPILPFPYNDQPNGIPWLYWGLLSRESTHNIRVRVIDLPLEPNSNSKTPNLNFVLGIYHLNGTFFGYQKVTDQLQICPTMAETNQRWQHPGTTYKNSCKFNIYKSSFNNFESLFYDLFIYDKNGALYPVPVRIKNAYTNGNIQNDVYTPNDNDTYVRRFSLFDTNVGTQNGQVNFIRIPQSIVIWFMIDSPGYVNVPVMDITYTERPISALSPTDLSEVSSIQFTFETRYIQNYSGLVTFSMIFFAIIATLMLLVAFHRTRAWYTRNLAFEAIDLFFLIRLIINLCESLASALFTFIVVLSLYFLVFFKTQSVLFLVVPSLSQEQAQFMLIIIGIAGIEFINITKSVLMQCTVELFFIDWEKSKGKLTDSGIDSKKPAPVSVWRSIFMSNEWARLQTFRKCNVEISLLGVLLFLEGFQWKNLGTNKPILSDLSDGDMNPILLFAADCICWGFMIFIQLSIRFVWYDRFYRNRVSQYIDIMSLTNISLLIFDERCHGYYIHGRSVHATADTDLENLNECLQKEASDLVPRRGYMDTNEQCFEIFVSKEFRNIFDKIYNPTEGTTTRAMNMMNRLNMNRSQEQNRRTSIQGEKFVKTYQTMNKFMKSFLEMNMKEFPLKTREKTFFEKLVGATPESNSNTLLKDNQTITSCLLLGIEQHILVFYICTFSYLHITCNNSVWAAAVVWILDIILCFIRLHFGEMNIAKKSLLDSKFLI